MIEPKNLTEQCISEQKIKPSLNVRTPQMDRKVSDEDLLALMMDYSFKPTTYQELVPRRTWSQRGVVLKDTSGSWLIQTQSFRRDENAS